MPSPKLLKGSLVKVCLYLRMSSDTQDCSLRDQRAEAQRYCGERGYEIVCEFVDEGISGVDTKKRRDFMRMMNEAGDGRWRIIVCWDMDRFGRFDTWENGHWVYHLRQRDVSVDTVKEGPQDWDSFGGQVIGAVNAGGNNNKVRKMSEDVNRALRARAKEGAICRKLPRGLFKKDGEVLIDEDVAAVIREIFRLYLLYRSTHRAAAELNRRGIPPARAALWTGASVHSTLTNEMYMGTFTIFKEGRAKFSEVTGGADGKCLELPMSQRGCSHRRLPADVVRHDNRVPAIIDPPVFLEVQRLLAQQQTNTSPRKNGRDFALAKLLRCGQCDGIMYGYTDAGVPCYICKRGMIHKGSCRRNVVPEAELLDVICTTLVKKFSEPDWLGDVRAEIEHRLKSRVAEQDTTTVRNRLSGVRAKMVQVQNNMGWCTTKQAFNVLEKSLGLLGAQESGLVEEIEALTAAGKATIADYDAQVRLIAREASVIEHIDRQTDSERLRYELGQIVSHVQVFVDWIDGHYSLNHVIIKPLWGAQLLTMAGRRLQDCAIVGYPSPSKAPRARSLTRSTKTCGSPGPDSRL